MKDMQTRDGILTIIGGLLASESCFAWAAGITESKRPESLVLMLLLLLTGAVQLVFYRQRQLKAHGTLALLCLGMLVGWGIRDGYGPPLLAQHFKALTYAAIVPLLLIHIQALYPRRWLGGMVDFTWAYVIPYAVIVLVYPPEQLVPILPAMEKFSFLSLATSVLAAAQARREQQPGASLLLFTLVFLFLGLLMEGLSAYALGLFTVAQAWQVSRLPDKAEGTRP